MNQRVAIGLLERRGHRVVVANNGKEALAALAAEAFDLVLMDVHMPEMDGYEATAAIRAAEIISGGHMPIIAMTASAMQGDRERCLEAGMDGYVAKPVNAKQLFAVIGEFASPPGRMPAESAAASQADGAAAPLDWAQALAQIEGNEALLQEMATLFFEECPKLLAAMQTAIAQGAAADLRRAAHTLKGEADIFAAEPTAAAASRLETVGRDGDWSDVNTAWAALQDAVARLLPALRGAAQV